MKLNRLMALNFLGARQIEIERMAPVTLVCGKNGSGKSSLRDAIALALTADLCRVSLKKEAGSLVSEGCDRADIAVETDTASYCVTITAGGQIKDSAKGADTPRALPLLLDPQRFAAMSPADRRPFLLELLGVETSHTAIAKRLARRNLDAKKVEAITPLLRGGFDGAARHAKEKATEAKGAWRAITGETWGATKGDSWSPKAIPAEADKAAERQAHAAKMAGECAGTAGILNQHIGAAMAKADARAKRAARIEALRARAAKAPNLQLKLERDLESLADAEREVEALGPAPGAASLRPPLACPECGSSVVLEGGVLRHYESPKGEDADKAARRQDWTSALELCNSTVKNTQRDLSDAREAAAEIAKLEAEAAQEDEAPDCAGLESELREVQAREREWRADETRYRDLAAEAKAASTAKGKASEHHADVKTWLAIADALSPDGIQSEILADALGPINDRLSEDADIAGWAAPRIGADMTISVAGRPYALLSESERWRVDALAAATIAHFSGLKLIVLDRFDVLDLRGRSDLLLWLASMAANGDIDSALVFGTLKAAPATLPVGCRAEWLEAGSTADTRAAA